MGIFNISSFATNDMSRNLRESHAYSEKNKDSRLPLLFTFNNQYNKGDLAQDLKERREAQEKQEAKQREENTKYLKKFAPAGGNLQSLPDLLAAKSQINQFKYYRNCTEKYDTSEIDNLMYAFKKQEGMIDEKINNINSGKEEEGSSVHLYSDIKRDFYA